ncbi:MAG: nickel-binding protein [Candidatus Limnocylindrales bacterium]
MRHGGLQPTFLVERYAADLSGDQLLSAGRRAEEAAPLLAPGARAHYLGSILLPSDEMAFCLFEGTSEAIVRGAVESADLAFERITPVVQVNGPDR